MESPSSSQRPLAAVLTNPALPSLYAWAATVGAPSLEAGASAPARLSALLALISCVAAGVGVARGRPWARIVGIYVFVGWCVASWLLLGVRASGGGGALRWALGGIGWAAFAFGWGGVRPLGSVPEEHPAAVPGPPLRARGDLPLRSYLAIALALLGAVLCLLLPWRVTRLPHAALAHLVGLAAAGALLIAAGEIAVAPRRPVGTRPASARLGDAWVPLTLLAGALLVGAVRLWASGAG